MGEGSDLLCVSRLAEFRIALGLISTANVARSEVMAGVAHQRGGAGMQHGEQAAPQVMKSLSETITTLHPFL